MDTNTKPMPDVPQKDNNNDNDQGRPVKVNMAGQDISRDVQKPPREYQQDQSRTKTPAGPALDDEEIDHSSESDFRYNTQKTGGDQPSRQI